MEEGGAALVLSSPRPTIDLATVARELRRRVAERARVSVLHDQIVLEVPREHLVDVARLVRDDELMRCDFYAVNAGVDLGGEMRSLTFVRGSRTKVFVVLRTTCTELDPHVPSLAGVWEGANWCERETYDMFGIVFDGHPDMRRIFLEESFPGHPLRRSFKPPRSDARGG